MDYESTPFTIQPAVRKGAPVLIGLWGPSGSGKTWTALHIARGLVGASGKIGLIDSENMRALFYADLVGGWDHLDLQPPFTPDRYTQAFSAFERAGQYGCVIVDTASHVWEGEGGVLDMADKIGGAGLRKWQAPKMSYKRMMNNLLRAPFHVIFCLRAKDAVRQIGSGKDAKIESAGVTPISGKGFIHEMTVSALLGPDHCPVIMGRPSPLVCDPLIPSVKAPAELAHIFKPGQPLGVHTGQEIAKWVSGGQVFDADQARLERVARDVATMGTEALERHWVSISKDERKALAGLLDELKAIAAESDRHAAEPEEEEQATL